MERDEVNDTLRLAADEIRRLRNQNALLGAKVEVLDLVGLLVNGRQSVGMGEDIAWKIDRLIANREGNAKAQPTSEAA